MTRSKVVKFIFWTTVIVALLYSSYRYPLQINSAQTSPTYSDTPPILQAGKYAFLALACVVMAFVAGGLYFPQRRSGFVTLYLTLIVLPFVHYALDQDAQHLAFPFVASATFFLALSVRHVSMKSIDAFLKFVLYLSLIVNLVQVFLFYSIGRLPALAYEETISVRFGSFIDDPNGFGALLFLLLGYVFCSPRTMTNRLCFVGVILSIVLSQSLTAIGFLVLLIVLWGLCNHLKATVLVLLLGCTPVLLSSLSNGFSSGGGGLLDVVFSSKMESSGAHFASFAVESLGDPTVWILGSDGYSKSESWWISSLSNYGLIWTASLMLLFCAFLWRLYITFRQAVDQTARRITLSALLFSVYVVLASFNLPFPIVFPINFIFMLFVCLIMLDKISWHDNVEHVESEVSNLGATTERRIAGRFGSSRS